MSDDSWDAWDAQYATLTSRRLAPENCGHTRRSKHDSHVCFDCRANVGPGGYIPGPPLQVKIQYLREVELGLQVVSINGDRPEYLISREWMLANPGKIPPVGDPPEAAGWKP